MIGIKKTGVNYISDNKAEIIIWVLYVVILCFVSYYHQPWHDEGQAWLIARDDSIWHLITVTNHYEGHPPLWHLVLMPFAKLGVSFPLGLKIINILFCALAMWLLIFKSPLPWCLRLTLPFTYFFFYQYGAVSRVYSLLMFGILAVAYYYPKRKHKPYKLALFLALVAGSQAYGMMFACGVAFAWLIEVLRRKQFNLSEFKSFWQDEIEVRALSLLFVLALCFGICMLPFSDTAFVSGGTKAGFYENLFYMFAVMPGQFLLSNNMQSNFTSNVVEFFITDLHIYIDMLPSNGIYGMLLLIQFLLTYTYGITLNLSVGYVCWLCNRFSLFICPLVLMNLLGALVYWNIYHTGVWVCFYVFILWQLWSDRNKLQNSMHEFGKKFTYRWEFVLTKWGVIIFYIAICLTNYSWSLEASKNNCLYKNDPSKQIADFIKENDLEMYSIWTTPKYSKDKDKKLDNVVTGSLAINCYFSHNVLQNLDGGNIDYAYHKYCMLPVERYANQVREFGQPDFILGHDKHLDYVFEYPEPYAPIIKFQYSNIWKNTLTSSYICLYIRKDLLPKFPQFNIIEIEKEQEEDD